MNVSMTSGASGASSLWSLLASRAAAASASTATSSSQACSASESSTRSAESGQRPEGPPPPSQFDCSMSTRQFAGMAPPGEDPIASLDTDEDGSVSAEEFGLDDAGDKVKQLFNAIDADGSGDLSSDEIDSFREKMMSAQGGRPPEPPMGPPPDASASAGGGTQDSDADDDTRAVASQARPDIGSFLQQLAERYASMAGASASSNATATALSVTA